MDTARLQRIQGLFLNAADLPESERGAFLETACGNDDALRAEVLAMLQEDAHVDSLLDGDLSQVARSILDGHLGDNPGSQLPKQLGPYRLVRMLGEGGMGVVFLAERADLRSLVAIKILRDAWLSPARRERFATEQRTLAQLNHPSIARLYDADTLPDGTPWFVMEYVEGLPITGYCQAHNTSIEQRLRLFRSVCEAVQYAHGHAIIHRDLKPSNILVRSDGTVGLLDFGISKQLDDLGQPVDQTRTELRLMTPAYAAPEQLRGERVGVFTDVYALGVILYELLAGGAPFDLSSRTPAEAERIIVEKTPEKPSTAARRCPAVSKTSWADLDVLCLTAMHKDAARRYQSVEALIRDVDHFLAGEPLEARPDTWSYRLGKFVRRNRRAVIATALATAAAAALIVFFTLRLATTRNTAVAAVVRMQRVQEFMLNLFSGGDKSAGPSEGLKAVTLVDRGIKEAQALQGQPELQAELYLTLGGIEEKLGNLPQADMLLNAAMALHNPEGLVAMGLLRVDQARLDDAERLIREGLAKATEARPRDDIAVAKATAALGKVLEAKGSYDKAIPVLEQAIQMESRSGAAPLDSAATLKELADTQFYAGHYDICDSLTQRTLEIHRQVLGEKHPLVADDLINLGAVQFERGHYVEAEKWYRQALQINEGWYGHDHPETASTLSMLGRSLVFQKRYDEAVNLVEQALAIQERVYGTSHPKVANVLNELGTVALQRDQFDEAASRFSRMVEIYKSAYGEHHYLYGLALANLASVYLAQKEFARAEQMFRKVIQCYAETLAPNHQFRAIAEIKLGRALTGEKRFLEAERETLAGYQMLLKQTSPTVSWLQSARKDLVTIYTALNKPEQASHFRTGLAASNNPAHAVAAK
jgi:eukaryotic-like serine/threonine-protein kinase